MAILISDRFKDTKIKILIERNKMFNLIKIIDKWLPNFPCFSKKICAGILHNSTLLAILGDIDIIFFICKDTLI